MNDDIDKLLRTFPAYATVSATLLIVDAGLGVEIPWGTRGLVVGQTGPLVLVRWADPVNREISTLASNLQLEVQAPTTEVSAGLPIVDANGGPEIPQGTRGLVIGQIAGALVRVSWAPPVNRETSTLASNLRFETPTTVTMTHERFESMTRRLPTGLLSDALVLLSAIECARWFREDTLAPTREDLEQLATAARQLRASFDRHNQETSPAPASAKPDARAWRSKWPADWPDCVTAGCEEPPSFAYIWPGHGRLHACFSCTTRMLGIAEAVGLSAKSLELVYLAGELVR